MPALLAKILVNKLMTTAIIIGVGCVSYGGFRVVKKIFPEFKYKKDTPKHAETRTECRKKSGGLHYEDYTKCENLSKPTVK